MSNAAAQLLPPAPEDGKALSIAFKRFLRDGTPLPVSLGFLGRWRVLAKLEHRNLVFRETAAELSGSDRDRAKILERMQGQLFEGEDGVRHVAAETIRRIISGAGQPNVEQIPHKS